MMTHTWHGFHRPAGAVTGTNRVVSTAPALNTHRVVFVDETRANTTIDRPYGYAPRGESVVGSVPPGHYKCMTTTAAFRAEGLAATQVLDGPMTAARFREYVTGVLVSALRPGDTVVLDNFPGHKGAAVEAVGCRHVYGPRFRDLHSPAE